MKNICELVMVNLKDQLTDIYLGNMSGYSDSDLMAFRSKYPSEDIISKIDPELKRRHDKAELNLNKKGVFWRKLGVIISFISLIVSVIALAVSIAAFLHKP